MLRRVLATTLLFFSNTLLPHNDSAQDFTLVHFLQFIASIRTANQSSARAKAKALALFSTLYCQGEEGTRQTLADLVPTITAITSKKQLSAKSKDKQMLIALEEKRLKLEASLPKSSPLMPHAAKLVRTIYAALNPTFGDFWRSVRIAIGSAIGGASFLAIAYFVYRAAHNDKSIANTARRALIVAEDVQAQLKSPGTTLHTIASGMATLTTELQTPGSVPHQLASSSARLLQQDGPVDQISTLIQAIQEKDRMLIAELLGAVTVLIQKGNARTGDGPLRQIVNLVSSVQQQNDAIIPDLAAAVTAKMNASLTATQEREVRSAFETLVHLLNDIHQSDNNALSGLVNAVTPLLTPTPQTAAPAAATSSVVSAVGNLTAHAAVTSINALTGIIKLMRG